MAALEAVSGIGDHLVAAVDEDCTVNTANPSSRCALKGSSIRVRGKPDGIQRLGAQVESPLPAGTVSFEEDNDQRAFRPRRTCGENSSPEDSRREPNVRFGARPSLAKLLNRIRQEHLNEGTFAELTD